MVVALLLLDSVNRDHDSVDNDLLCRKLVRFFGFFSSVVYFLESYLHRRLQYVFVNGVFSVFSKAAMLRTWAIVIFFVY
jgi:hypothetical protein